MGSRKDTLNINSTLDNADKILSMVQNVTKDVEDMKLDHEDKIKNLEESLDKVQDKLGALVVVSRIVMKNSSSGLMQLNEKVQAIQGLFKGNYSYPTLSVKGKVKKEVMLQHEMGTGPTLSSYTRTCSHDKGKSIQENIFHSVLNIKLDAINKNEELLRNLQ